MQHLDEGTIHAWLDGALSAEESERLEAHAASCAACGALVAEARGLIAASSRILAALDNVPREVIPSAATSGAAAAAVMTPRSGPRVPFARIAAVVAFVAVGGMALRIAIGGSGPAVVASKAVKQEQLGAGDTMGVPMAPPPAAAVSAPVSDSTASRARAAEVAAVSQATRRDAEGTVLAGGRGGAPRDEQPQSNAALKAQTSGFADKRRDGARQRLAREQDAADATAVRAPTPTAATPAAAYRVAEPSDQATVRGRVTDAGTGAGIGNAQVVVEGSSVGALTNESGAFNLPVVPSGQQTLRVRRLGYELEQRQIEAPAGDTVALDVEMHPAQVAMDEVVVTSSAALARSAIKGLTLVSRTTELADGREIETSVYDYRPGIQVMLRVATPLAAPAQPSRELREPIVERAGIRTLRWTDADGSEFTLSGALSERQMRELRERIR